MSDGGKSSAAPGALLAVFLRSRRLARSIGRPAKYLGMGEIARVIGAAEDECSGHWCSRCQGIWYGWLTEVACPACGNRRG